MGSHALLRPQHAWKAGPESPRGRRSGVRKRGRSGHPEPGRKRPPEGREEGEDGRLGKALPATRSQEGPGAGQSLAVRGLWGPQVARGRARPGRAECRGHQAHLGGSERGGGPHRAAGLGWGHGGGTGVPERGCRAWSRELQGAPEDGGGVHGATGRCRGRARTRTSDLRTGRLRTRVSSDWPALPGTSRVRAGDKA